MKLILAITLLSITLAQQCQIETCEDLENALVKAEKQAEELAEENQIAIQKQKRLQDKLRQLNVCLSYFLHFVINAHANFNHRTGSNGTNNCGWYTQKYKVGLKLTSLISG